MSIASDAGVMAFAMPPAVARGQTVEPRLYRFTVDQYHRMGELGILEDDARVELLEGMIVKTSPIGPPHTYTTQIAHDLIAAGLPSGWTVRMQSPITFERSEPEPDLAVVRGRHADYKRRHPQPAEVGLLIETSDSSLALDRTEKGPIYAGAQIPCYWVINLLDRQVEVYSEPIPATDARPAHYAQQVMFGENDKAPLILDGRTVLLIAVHDLLP